MKNIIFAAPILALMGCMETGTDVSLAEPVETHAVSAITTEAAFLAAVGDRRIELQGQPANNLVIAANGTISGTFGGSNLAGTWAWRDGAWCRTLSEGPRGPSPEDCQTWAIAPDGSFLVTRDRGAGQSFVYEIS